jgi:hypothetical protein
MKRRLYGWLVIITTLWIGVINFESTLSRFESYRIFPSDWYTPLVTISLIMFTIVTILYYRHHRFTWKDLWIWGFTFYPLLTTFFVPSIIDLSLYHPSLAEGNTLFLYTDALRFQDVHYGMSIGFLFFLIFRVVVEEKLFQSMFYTVFYLGVLFVIGELAYSVVTEWDSYVYMVEHFDEGARLSILSFTSNPNIFAFHLSLGIYAIGTLVITERKEVMGYVLFFMLFFLALILTVSKTSIFAMMVYVIVYLGLLLFYGFRKRIIIRDISLLVWGGAIVMFMYLTFTSDHGWFVRLETLLTTSLQDSLDSRIPIWNRAVDLLQGVYTWVGYGMGTSSIILGISTATIRGTEPFYVVTNDRFHQGILELFVSLGWIGVILLSVGLAYYAYRFYKLRWTAHHIPVLAMMISFLFHTLTEDRMFFRPDLGGIFFFMLCLLPFVSKDKETVSFH